MTKLAYLECPTGIAGDMCLGALVDAGVPLEYLQEQLKGLGIEREYQLRVDFVHRNGQLATKFHVDLLGNEHHHHDNHTHHHGRHLPEIEDLILKANLPIRAEAWSLAVFRQLAVAEGAVHGIAPEKVHFHEVGAVDAIVDIVGTCLGLDWLGIDKIYCSALPTGGGTVKAAHGLMAVPVPAVLKLWEMRTCPVYSNGIQKELVTPTGAAIATTLATDFGSPPAMTIQRIGQGAGSIHLPIPNILRLWLGVETLLGNVVGAHGCAPLQESNTSPFLEAIAVLETQIDDLNPQAIGYVLEALLAAGALDVFTQSIGMKKSRPGILLTVICHPDKVTDLEAIVFRETTTLGIRRYAQQRLALQREIQSVTTDYGTVRIKIAWTGTATERQITNVQPEYEDCWQIARRHDLPWREVHRLALQAWYEKNSE
ncbi:nickel pincer cofactor biosynthesis protein LarC [Chroococcidiopsis sp. FACHB-1243]|uniref:nickel pincer cofactor biosynthesis protein LarC n=1 Tax=Chroococcidiopsis sp. [FACHB-1243] TaxID=2692781 RepID=UPI0017844514|nr:nickel pincer cofactor biosynthesis protein LarC [Chroococcidiopsis sp. [FACHB-1243]]MBD2308499.1 nickel pincer cofactor biosynthesis protein LarC [Chroococcidiopsis sp. [FACHB-1243]]